jgi:hypothetical protein
MVGGPQISPQIANLQTCGLPKIRFAEWQFADLRFADFNVTVFAICGFEICKPNFFGRVRTSPNPQKKKFSLKMLLFKIVRNKFFYLVLS